MHLQKADVIDFSWGKVCGICEVKTYCSKLMQLHEFLHPHSLHSLNMGPNAQLAATTKERIALHMQSFRLVFGSLHPRDWNQILRMQEED